MYSDAQARKIAEQIYRRFGYKIHLACSGEGIEESFLAGFIGVEAGKDRTGQLVEGATRFERHVFEKLRALRDGLRPSYQRISSAQIRGASDAALRNLATSFGLTQIMGWHTVNNLKGSVADLRNPEMHLHYAVRLLKLVGGSYLRRRDYASVLRIWNTGSANGKTYHADYVPNALLVKAKYESILRSNPRFEVKDADVDKLVAETAPASIPAATPAASIDNRPAESSPTGQSPQPAGSSVPVDDTAGFEFGGYIEKATETIGPVVDNLERTQQTFDGVRRGHDSVKAMIATFMQLLFQPVWAVAAFFVAMPWWQWIVVAGLVGAALFLWHHRQLIMGRIRETGII